MVVGHHSGDFSGVFEVRKDFVATFEGPRFFAVGAVGQGIEGDLFQEPIGQALTLGHLRAGISWASSRPPRDPPDRVVGHGVSP